MKDSEANLPSAPVTDDKMGWLMFLRKHSLMLLLVIVGAWIVYAAFVIGYFEKVDDAGKFGDLFGGLNALFSGLAFAALILTLILQREELALQRSELKETRTVLEAQRQQMELQNTTLKKQKFEGTFFQMLGLYNEIVNSIDAFPITGRPTKGRDACHELYNTLTRTYAEVKVEGESQRLPQSIKNFYDSYGRMVEHLNKFTADILRFLHNSELSQPDHKFYSGILRSLLARDELLLLFYYGISDKTPSDFKFLMEGNSFFCDIRKEFLLKQEHLEFYSASAYKK